MRTTYYRSGFGGTLKLLSQHPCSLQLIRSDIGLDSSFLVAVARKWDEVSYRQAVKASTQHRRQHVSGRARLVDWRRRHARRPCKVYEK